MHADCETGPRRSCDRTYPGMERPSSFGEESESWQDGEGQSSCPRVRSRRDRRRVRRRRRNNSGPLGASKSVGAGWCGAHRRLGKQWPGWADWAVGGGTAANVARSKKQWPDWSDCGGGLTQALWAGWRKIGGKGSHGGRRQSTARGDDAYPCDDAWNRAIRPKGAISHSLSRRALSVPASTTRGNRCRGGGSGAIAAVSFDVIAFCGSGFWPGLISCFQVRQSAL